MLAPIRKTMKSLFRFLGLDVRRIRYSTELNRLVNSLCKFEIDTVLDVGANRGQFSRDLRSAGYRGRIVSFEPGLDAHNQLTQNARHDPAWIVHPRSALGDQQGIIALNISRNSVSSSILGITDTCLSAARDSRYVASENVPMSTLDSVASRYIGNENKAFLKIDTQGYEWQVLDGAAATLPRIRGIHCEVSLIELYQGQRLWQDVIERLNAEGFTVWSIDRGFSDIRDGRTLQLDIVFFRMGLPASENRCAHV